jgi:hypothetical protein
MRGAGLGAIALFLTLSVYAAPETFDLDLEVPVGSPLDWDRELPQPVPNITTGTPGRAMPKPKEEPKAAKGSGTQIAAPPVKPTPPPMIGFGIPNLYNFFRIKTIDIMNHISPNIPTKPNNPFRCLSGCLHSRGVVASEHVERGATALSQYDHRVRAHVRYGGGMRELPAEAAVAGRAAMRVEV